jgi:hypothetical protein
MKDFSVRSTLTLLNEIHSARLGWTRLTTKIKTRLSSFYIEFDIEQSQITSYSV